MSQTECEGLLTPSDLPLIRAGVYARESTDHQKYSIGAQLEFTSAYALANRMVVSRTYLDPAKSGLTIRGRYGLQALLADIEDGSADFSVILIFDISRWGRYQDLDEAAHYEYLCRKAKKRVIYCAEEFVNDGSPMSFIYKLVGRMAAAKFSSDLSKKVFIGQCRALTVGCWPGAPPSIGLRRGLLGKDGQLKLVMNRGEQKALTLDRTILVPGPESEVQQVRRAFEMFAIEGKTIASVTRALNGDRVEIGDLVWTYNRVHRMLRNENYIGNLVYNRTSRKLKGASIKNPPEDWKRNDGTFSPLIPVDLFEKAQAEIRRRATRYDKGFLLERLTDLLRRKGELSVRVINGDTLTPSDAAYRAAFGTLAEAYELAGYCHLQSYERYVALKRVKLAKQKLLDSIRALFQGRGIPVTSGRWVNSLRINDEWTLAVSAAYCSTKRSRKMQWSWRHVQRSVSDVTVLGRLDPGNAEFLDYYVIPLAELKSFPHTLRERNGITVDAYRVPSIDGIASYGQRVALEDLLP